MKKGGGVNLPIPHRNPPYPTRYPVHVLGVIPGRVSDSSFRSENANVIYIGRVASMKVLYGSNCAFVRVYEGHDGAVL